MSASLSSSSTGPDRQLGVLVHEYQSVVVVRCRSTVVVLGPAGCPSEELMSAAQPLLRDEELTMLRRRLGLT